ncbi:TcpE family conjugal transfer membrane protein [Actinomadura scrupuli]|uniref:conjugal transfer protein n=1 Tax=Actinomadura scrupuli TaxID=559629 RepID=UPI003D96D3D9
MDLPTYTNIWRIEKRLYKLYDLRLPMPLPLVQIGVFLGVFVPWIVLLKVIGIPFRGGWILPLYIVPPFVLTWMATRPVIEGKRLTELLLSQSRYLVEPRTWCRLTPIREPREVVVVVKVWRRPGDAASSVAAAVRSDRKARKAQQKAQKVRKAERGRRPAPVRVSPRPAVMPGAGQGPAYTPAPQPLSAQLAALDATTTSVHPEPQAPAARSAEREPAPVQVRAQTHRWPPPDPRDRASGQRAAAPGWAGRAPAQPERPPVTPRLEQPAAFEDRPPRPGPPDPRARDLVRCPGRADHHPGHPTGDPAATVHADETGGAGGERRGAGLGQAGPRLGSTPSWRP